MRHPDCHPQLAYKANGLCSACYVKSRIHLLPRATCHPDKPKITADGLCQRCRDQRYYAANPIARSQRLKRRTRNELKNNYGLTPAQFEEMVKAQGGACAICRKEQPKSGTKGRLSVDHDHKTGVVRGLLCDSCNRAIGMLGDTFERVRAAADYLQRSVDHIDSGAIGKGCNQ